MMYLMTRNDEGGQFKTCGDKLIQVCFLICCRALPEVHGEYPEPIKSTTIVE
jgi:hypothetical protein